MRPISLTLVLALALSSAAQPAAAQTGSSEPYKLGTFRQSGRTFLGVVLGDTRIIDLAKANAAYEGSNASAKKLAIPADMNELISRYEGEWKARLLADPTQFMAAYLATVQKAA